jgi:hypothetical protein
MSVGINRLFPSIEGLISKSPHILTRKHNFENHYPKKNQKFHDSLSAMENRIKTGDVIDLFLMYMVRIAE